MSNNKATIPVVIPISDYQRSMEFLSLLAIEPMCTSHIDLNVILASANKEPVEITLNLFAGDADGRSSIPVTFTLSQEVIADMNKWKESQRLQLARERYHRYRKRISLPPNQSDANKPSANHKIP